MNKSQASRVAHTSIAGLIALATYIVVIHYAAGQPDSWNFFGNENCQNPISGAFCAIAGMVSILYTVATVGLPIALILSSIYLKLARFSLLSAIVIPLCANTLGIVAIVFIAQYLDTIPLQISAFIIPLAYMGMALVGSKNNRLHPTNNQRLR